MSLEAETLLRSMADSKRLLLWRGAAVLFFLAALIIAVGKSHSTVSSLDARPHIARLVIHGVIGNDVSQITTALRKAQKSSSVTGLLLVVDSPGGGVTGGERLHDSIEKFAQVKPVVVTMGDMGASAAYMLSVPAQHIVALPSTLTGSIGVILQRPDLSPLLGRVGIDVADITSGAMKDQTDPTSHLTPEGRTMLQGLVNDLFDQFVAMVVKGRHMPEDKVRSLADGRAYTGRQALSLGLIDELGDEDIARQWLRQRLKIGDAQYPVMPLLSVTKRHWYDFPRKRAMLEGVFGSGFTEMLEGRLTLSSLDGAVAILQP
ncbi:signal peptide peptidase SppA [Gluconobacter cerinus]|uniref:signal peptide peptidase SppA n=1 Tax=Gluconobacter cerinus TaxID=38307 RepID=UPI001B8ABCA9|nr:signal peptide peptidase SppA [Gluconobacter cerinus]MBS1018753.1 signal peptide peptidase SppA [Gluconobacter cerinus]